MKKHKDIIAVIAVVGLVIAAMVFATTPKGTINTKQTASIGNLLDQNTNGEWTKGNPNASLTLVEYSDFQCPACGTYYPIVKQLMGEFGDRVKLVYRHFPLRQVHESADLAARAAEAAGVQGKFWEMHDTLFENQKRWTLIPFAAETAILNYAKSLGLTINQFKNDLNSPETETKVENNYQSGISAGVNHTPTFFINGKEIQNPQSYDEFRNTIIKTLGA